PAGGPKPPARDADAGMVLVRCRPPGPGRRPNPPKNTDGTPPNSPPPPPRRFWLPAPPPIFERDVLALDIAQFVQFLAKRLPVGAVVDDADARDRCRARTATRPCRRSRKSCCSANELYDLPAVHNSRPERRTRLAHSARTLPRDPKPLPFRR